MRISTLQTINQGINSMRSVSEQSYKTQNQIASNKRVLTPSDDPVASARIQQLTQDQALRDQYKSNIDRVQGRLDLEEAQLMSIGDILIRIKEQTLAAGNAAYSHADRQAIAVEMEQRLNELVSLMNGKDANGEYIFSGFKGQTMPFVRNDAGGYDYMGDEGRRYVSISSSSSVAANDTGKSIFVDIESAKRTFYTMAGPNNTSVPPATISQGVITDQEEYDAFYPDDMVVSFYSSARGLEYLVTSKGDGRVLADSASEPNPYGGGATISVKGVSFTINGTPSVNDSFFIESTPKQGLLTTIGKLVEGLRTIGDNDPEALRNMLDASLANIDNAQNRLLQVRADIGARMNTLDSTKGMLEQVDIASKAILSDLRDLDYAEAVSRLKFETFVLEAAQQSYVKVQGLSLFNFLR
jgi:flagellar hook-associated protein 3 FlgL